MQSKIKQQILLGLFKQIHPSLKAEDLKDLIKCEKIWFLLTYVDSQYFGNAHRTVEHSLAGILRAIGDYLLGNLALTVKYDVAVKLAHHDQWYWSTLLLYLMVMSQRRQETINVILRYESQVQSFFMELISQTESNFSPAAFQSNDQDIMRKVEEYETIIQQLTVTIKEKDITIRTLQEDVQTLRDLHQSITCVEATLKTERFDLLEVIGVNTIEDLLVKHSSMVKDNDKLRDLIVTRDEEFNNLKQLYHQTTMNLESLLTTVQDQDSFSPQKKEDFQRRRSSLLSKKEMTYIQSIESHVKPLLQDIMELEKRNRLLEKQIKLLYKNFKKMLTQLKPCREWGLLEDVPGVIF